MPTFYIDPASAADFYNLQALLDEETPVILRPRGPRQFELVQQQVVVGRLIFGSPPPALPEQSQLPLRPRQRQVLRLIAKGASNRRIAEQLGLTEKAVEYHVTKLLTTLGVTSRVQLVRYLHQAGWDQFDEPSSPAAE